MKRKFPFVIACLLFHITVQAAADGPMPQINPPLAQPSQQTSPSGAGGDGGLLFGKYDQNQDGKISRLEAKTAGISEDKFKKADTNNDGFIDRKEFQVAILLL